MRTPTFAAIESAVIDAALDCVVAIDEAGRIVAFNPAAETTFGYRREEVIGQELAELLIPPELRDAHHQGMNRYLSTGEARMLGQRRIEIDALHRSGAILQVELAIGEVTADTGRYFVAYLRDLSDKRRLEAEIHRQEEALRNSEKMSAMGSLLANVAHELNNPLSALITQTELLVETTQDERMAKRALRIKKNAERCAGIVKQFLAKVRRDQPIQSRTDLNAVIKDSVELMRYAIESGGIEVKLNLDTELPLVMCDGEQLGQVLINLINNAQQAMLGFSREIPHRLDITSCNDTENDALRITVVDTGPGVPDYLTERIFDAFFTTKSMGSGTGIGLALSAGIVKAQGGTLSLAHNSDQGACFAISLPRKALMCEEEQPTHDGADSLPDLPSLAILVVDDEEDMRLGLEEMLARQGHRVTSARSGREALEWLKMSWFDVVLSDIRMPDGDGIELAEQILSQALHPVDRFGFITGDHMGEHVRRYLAEHHFAYLTKPFGAADLYQLLGALMAGK